MSIAEQTRTGVREHPFLYEALRAGVLNYTAAARFLDVGDEEAVAAALRRYETELNDEEPPAGTARVTMERNLGPADPSEAILVVGDTALAPGDGSLTGILATGGVSPPILGRVLGRCETADLGVEAAGVAGDTLCLVVERRDGPDAVRLVEDVC